MSNVVEILTHRFDPSQEEALNQPPNVKTRQGPGGSTVPYVAYDETVTKLNEIFGPAGWSTVIQPPTVVLTKSFKNSRQEDRIQITAVANCTLTIHAKEHNVTRSNVGACDAEASPRDETSAYQMALKGAASDALKRAAESLGTVFGYSLKKKEDKSQTTGNGYTNTRQKTNQRSTVAQQQGGQQQPRSSGQAQQTQGQQPPAQNTASGTQPARPNNVQPITATKPFVPPQRVEPRHVAPTPPAKVVLVNAPGSSSIPPRSMQEWQRFTRRLDQLLTQAQNGPTIDKIYKENEVDLEALKVQNPNLYSLVGQTFSNHRLRIAPVQQHRG